MLSGGRDIRRSMSRWVWVLWARRRSRCICRVNCALMVVVSAFVYEVYRLGLLWLQHFPSGWRYPSYGSLSESLDLTIISKNAPCSPIAVIACYSGSSQDDHHVRIFSSTHKPAILCVSVGCNSREGLSEQAR